MGTMILVKNWKEKNWTYNKRYEVNDDKTFFVVLNEFIQELNDAIYSLFEPDGLEKLINNSGEIKISDIKRISKNLKLDPHFIELSKPMIVYSILKKEKTLPWYQPTDLAKELNIQVPVGEKSEIDYESLNLIIDYEKFVSIKKFAIEPEVTIHDLLSVSTSMMSSLLNHYDKWILKLGLVQTGRVQTDLGRVSGKDFKTFRELIDYIRTNKLNPPVIYLLLKDLDLLPVIDPKKFNSVYKEPEFRYLKIKIKKRRKE